MAGQLSSLSQDNWPMLHCSKTQCRLSPMAGAAGDELPRAMGSLSRVWTTPSRSTVVSCPANAHNGRPKLATTAAERGVGAELGTGRGLAHQQNILCTAGTEGEESASRRSYSFLGPASRAGRVLRSLMLIRTCPPPGTHTVSPSQKGIPPGYKASRYPENLC